MTFLFQNLLPNDSGAGKLQAAGTIWHMTFIRVAKDGFRIFRGLGGRGGEEGKESTFLLWPFTGKDHGPSSNDQGLPGAADTTPEKCSLLPRGDNGPVWEKMNVPLGKGSVYSDAPPKYGGTKEGHPAQPWGLRECR